MTSSIHIKFPVIFIRGLSLRGDDHLGIGPLRVGSMPEHLKKAFHKNEAVLSILHGLKLSLLDEQLEKSIDFVQNQGFEQFHILTHSMGAILARAMSHDERVSQKIVSIVTIAAPHRGSVLANKMIHYSDKYPILSKLFKQVGFDIDKSIPIFTQVQIEAMETFNKRFPMKEGIPFGSVICELPLSEQGFPLQEFHKILIKDIYEDKDLPPHDGLIEKTSQPWGEIIGEYGLDHLSQLGFHLYFSLKARRSKEKEFQKMVQDILQFMSSVEGNCVKKDS